MPPAIKAHPRRQAVMGKRVFIMVSLQKQRTTGALLSYGSMAVRLLSALLYTPVMLRMLGQAEFGLYQMVLSVVGVLELLNFGFNTAYVRFFMRYRASGDAAGLRRMNGVFLLAFLGLGLICLALGGVLYGNADWLLPPDAPAHALGTTRTLLLIMILTLALSFPLSIFDCNLAAHEEFIFRNSVVLAEAACNPLLTLPLLFLGYKSVSLAVVALTLTVLKLGICAQFCFRRNGMRFSFRQLRWGLFAEVAIFSSWMFLNVIYNQVNWNIGKFIVGKYCGPEESAILALGLLINGNYLLLAWAVSNVFVPAVNRLVAEGQDPRELSRLFVRIGRIQFFIVFPVLCGFALLGRYFIHIWAGPGYESAYAVTLLLIAPLTIDLIQNISIEVQKARNMHQFRSAIYVAGAALNLLLTFWLVPRHGAVGAATGVCLPLLVFNGLIMNWYYHARVGLNIVVFWQNIMRILPAALAPALLCWGVSYIWPVNSLAVFAGMGSAYLLLYLVCIYWGAMNGEERAFMRRVLHRLHLVR